MSRTKSLSACADATLRETVRFGAAPNYREASNDSSDDTFEVLSDVVPALRQAGG